MIRLSRTMMALALVMTTSPAWSQSTATPSVMGYLSSSNHSCGQTTCFVQYGATVPTGGGGGVDNVNVAQVNGVTVLTGAGATGTGSQRTTVAQDATTIAGAAPGTAGTPSTNVVSVQGVSGGTPQPTSQTAGTGSATAALASNKVLKGAAGTLYNFQVVGDATAIAATWYVLVFDATSLPADGAVTPAQCYPVASGNPLFSAAMPNRGTAFATGITVGISSTGCFTQTTLGAHAFISGSTN